MSRTDNQFCGIVRLEVYGLAKHRSNSSRFIGAKVYHGPLMSLPFLSEYDKLIRQVLFGMCCEELEQTDTEMKLLEAPKCERGNYFAT